jgi:hypothetical protein
MATIKRLFSDAIQQGMKAANGITDFYEKAIAYAALADAMARTGLIAGNNLEEAETDATAAASTTEKGKNSLKPEATKTKAAPAASKKEEKKVEPEPKPAAETEPELTEEWTDEMVELKSEQIAFINKLKEEYEESALNNCVEQFSEKTMSTLDEITPLNIDAFVAFMQALINQQEQG